MLRTTLNRVTLCAVLAAGCTTQFETDGSTDGSPDTTGDTSVDGPADAPGDGDDAPGDVEPDGAPPTVECGVIRDVENAFETAVNIEYGCDTTEDRCSSSNVWIMEHGANLVVLHGSESVMVDPDVRLLANMLGVGDMRVRAETVIPDPVPFRSLVRGGSMLERTVDWDVLLVSAVDISSTGDPRWNLWRVAVEITGSDSLSYDESLLLSGGVADTVGALEYPRGVAAPGSSSVHVFASLSGSGGGGANRLFGATLTRTTFERGGLSFTDAFHPLQPDATSMCVPVRPDASGDLVVIPYIEVTDSPEISSGLWSLRGAIGPSTTTHSLGVVGSRARTAGAMGTFIAPGTFAVVAMSTDSPFDPESLLDPPYQLGSAVIVGDEIDSPVVETPDVFDEIPIGSPEDVRSWDITDNMVLHDPTTGLHYFIMLLQEDGGPVQVWLFPLREDGSAGGEPLMFNTEQRYMPAFDATINPETGAIYLARHMETGSDAMGRIPGFHVTEIDCTLTE